MLVNPPPQQNPVTDKMGKALQVWVRFFTSLGTTIDRDGNYRPNTYPDADAPNNSVYYSSTTSKLTYSDPAGVKHALY